MKTRSPGGNEIWRPTREEVQNIMVGDLALDCFGKWNRITSIFAMGDNIHGKAYACFYTAWGENASISHSIGEDEIVSTIPLVREYNRIDNIRL